MGGFKRVARALDLAYLRARQGRSETVAWSPSDAARNLTLVQFSGASRAPKQQPGGDNDDAGESGAAHAAVEPAVQLRPVAVRTRRLSRVGQRLLALEQQARAGDQAGEDGAATEGHAAAAGGRAVVVRASSSRNGRGHAPLLAPGHPFSPDQPPAAAARKGLAVSLGEHAHCHSVLFQCRTSHICHIKLLPLPDAQCLLESRLTSPNMLRAGLLQEDDEDSSEMAAPLLRSVAREVQRFAAGSGFARMPTKQEMRALGKMQGYPSGMALGRGMLPKCCAM